MFDLDKALASWRETYARNDSIDLDSLTELENHLRDEIDALMDQGLSSQEAYEEACAQLGQESTLNAEYAKVHPDVSWKRRMLAMLVGYMSVGVLLSAAGMITSLFERVLWYFGLDKVVCSLPWSVYVENSAFRATSTEASADIIRWDEVSLATLLTAGVRAVALGMIVYLIYRCLHGRVGWLSKLLARCRSAPDRLVVSLIVLGTLLSQVVVGRAWYFRLVQFLSNGNGSSKFGMEMRMNGEAAISPVTIWIQPLAYCLIAWFAFQAYRKPQLSGRYDVLPTAICGFLIGSVLVRMTSFLNSLIMVNFELAETGFNQGAPLAPAVYVFSLSVVAGAFVLAISGRGFPTLRRFLTSLPRRPYLVMTS